MRDLDQRAREADAKNKIWQYKTRRIVLFFLITGGILTILDKCPSIYRRTQTNVVPPVSADSTKKDKSQSHQETASLSHKKRHPKTEEQPTRTNSQGKIEQSTKEQASPTYNPPPKIVTPVQVANSDNIEFKLMKAGGSSKAQTITITMVLTTNTANWYIMSRVHSIIDNDGSEYKLKAFTIGANNYFPKVELVTGIPIKCTYTFGGVLPDVKNIKLFKFDYAHSLGQPFDVEFRDIPVEWQ